jgi:hypothetical protein
MSWTAAEFLDLIEQRGIMASDHVDHLREQLSAAGCEIHAVHVARKLVEHGYLNPYFAKTLLEEGYLSRRAGAAESGLRTATSQRGAASKEDELDLAPLEEEKREEQAALAAGPPIDLKIDLPPIHDPDAWPASDPPLLPAADPHSAFSAIQRLEAEVLSRRGPKDTPWIVWALSGAVLVLAILVVMLLAGR